MQGRVTGFFLTLVMALPLAAIPLMSIFGIPQFNSLASSAADTGFLLEAPGFQSGEGREDAWDLDAAPAFGAESKAPRSNPAAVRTAELSAEETAGPFDAAFRTPAGGTRNVSASASDTSGQLGLTWESALQQLASFGIHDYRLQPGYESRGFHFACYSHQPIRTAGNGTRATVIRFEAEANDPLKAVSQTLRQVEQWHQQRSSHSSAGATITR